MAMAIRRYGKVKNMAMHLFWSFVGPEFTDQAVRESMILDFAKSTSDYSWSDWWKWKQHVSSEWNGLKRNIVVW